MSPRSLRAALAAVTVTLLMLAASVVAPRTSSQPATSAQAATTVTLTGYGGDSCTAPSESQMRAFWSNTPYSYWGVYIGGADRGCAQPNLTSTWVSHMITMGWDLLPIWVGRQNPCTPGQAAYFSTNTTTAYSQGKAEALAAYKAWRTLSSVSTVPIDYDLEASGTDTATCRAAAKSFINGWVAQLHVAPAQKAGVYSSSCAGYLDDFAHIPHPPDFIDAADWDNSASTGGISCVASNHWIYHQRHKQYRGGHNATYNGVTLNIDSRCSDGPVYGAASRASSTQACARTAASAAVTRANAQADAASAPVTWRGAQWQAGGPQDAQLLRAPAAHPQLTTPVRLADLPLRTHDVPADAATIGAPQVLADGSLLVPVTEHVGARATQAFFTTRDGTHFTRRGAVPLDGATAPGVTAATAVLRNGRILVVDPTSQSATVWRAGATTRFSVRGLPAGAQAVRTDGDDDTLSAVAENGSCRTKTGCTVRPSIYRTADGGRTWNP